MGEVGGCSTGNEVTVGIVPFWQLDDVHKDASMLQAQGELMRSFLASLILILVKDDVDGTARLLSKLGYLSGR